MVGLRRGKRKAKKSVRAGRPESARLVAVRKQVWMISAGLIVVFVVLTAILLSIVLHEDDAPAPTQVASSSTPLDVELIAPESFGKDFNGRIGEVPPPEKTTQNTDTSAPSSSAVSSTAGTDGYEYRITYRSGVVDRYIFDDVKQSAVTEPILVQLSEIFGWDIDFTRDMREGDSYLVMYEEKYQFGRRISGTVLAAQFVNRGKAYRAIGFPESGKMAYFTPDGKRLRRMFLRSPVQFSIVSSPFSKARYHPILNIWRAHTGVDYAAATGTPVRATASGRVVSVGWSGAYGKTIVLKHVGTYSTLYAHLSRYRQGLEAGTNVVQGEVIGYVGRSGLATGPHLHYEFRVNGEHRDPLTFEPRDAGNETISSKLRDEFLLAARARTAQLDLLSGQQVAAQ